MNENMNLTDDSQPLSDEAYIITGIYVTALGIVAFFGNSFALVVLAFGRPNFHRIHTVLLFSTAICDLLIACTAYPLTAAAGFYKRWVFGDGACVFSGFVVYFLITSNINSLCVLAIARYIIVCKPEYEYLLQRKNIKWILMIIWFLALFWTGSPLLGWSSYKQEPFKTSCTVNWYGQTIADVTYNSLCTIFCYVLPVAIFIFCYYNVGITTVKRTRNDLENLKNRVYSLDEASRPQMEVTLERLARNQKIRASRHMTVVCLAMVVAFVVTWTPYAILTIWNIVVTPTSAAVQVLPTMFAKLSCTLNPILYCTLCERFREAAWRIFHRTDQRIHPEAHTNGSGQTVQRELTVDIEEINLRKQRIRILNQVIEHATDPHRYPSPEPSSRLHAATPVSIDQQYNPKPRQFT